MAKALGEDVTVKDIADADAHLSGNAVFLISSYGDGFAADSAMEFIDSIKGADLSGLRYSAFGLGDSTYSDFNSGVRLVTEALDAAGAKRVGEIGQGDDQDAAGYETKLEPWIKEQLPLLGKREKSSGRPQARSELQTPTPKPTSTPQTRPEPRTQSTTP